jgi:hypothetical protein
VGNVTLLPGETKPVDVLIRSSDGSDFLQAYAIRLQLDTTGIGSLLQFADPPSNAEWLDSNYVFFNDSAAQSPPSTFAMLGTTVTTNDTLDTADFTLSGNDVPLTMSDQLLARVDVTALAGGPGGNVHLNFVAASSSFFNAAGDELTVLAEVPEPFSFLLWAGGFAIMATANRFRRRA